MNDNERWERDALREIALEGIKERRRSRRWGIFFKILLFGYLLALLALSPSCQWRQSWMATDGEPERHTAVVDIAGPILAETPASAQRIIAGLNRAFDADNVAGVVLRINSPGGSPVQAGRINDEVRRLKAVHADIPVYAVTSDLCASGAYYVAVAADRIYADKASIIGSIGVLMGGFGFTGTMDKLGVERRLYTAGDNKAFLDPFSPQQEQDVARIQEMLDNIHQQFIDVVKAGRGDQLATENEDLFSGMVWTGEQAIELGLADDLGSPESVARDVIGAERMIEYTPEDSLLQRFADRLGVSAAGVLGSALEWPTTLR